MTALITLLEHTSKRIIGAIHYRATSFEHCITYDRRDGKRVEMAVTHIPDVSGEGQHTPVLQLATRKLRRTNSLNEYIGFSMEEARILRDFLNREEVSAWLDEEEEEA